MQYPTFLTGLALLVCTTTAHAQHRPEDIAAARQLLHARKAAAGTATDLEIAQRLIGEHRYAEAQRRVDAALRQRPTDAQWLALRVRLLIQAWRLEEAMQVARAVPQGVAQVGRIQLLQKQYDAALVSAKAAQTASPQDAAGYLLEADVHFWNNKPELADAPLERALALDPLNADARFAYGYALWRRVDPRLLPAMAEQWNFALEIDPLHYFTHWHFGNGHTHLTYADYVQPTDSAVRARLAVVDSLVASNRLSEALQLTRDIDRAFPQSWLPELARGSVFYMAADMPRALRLDSAEKSFRNLLRRKPNYGPAHNALAAVIKQRQFTYHASFDSLEAEIARQPVPTDSAFYREFRNIRYYPGERVEKMAAQQLGPARAYIPFIARMGYSYVIPPLHHDLTQALNQPFFRTSTTFDNRQWMDIRGSGGNHASAGIEYVERGSHQERVVLLHEYVHQFHGAVLTDQQNRRIRQLYYDAMANNRTLDYYAANNESEFFAQSYEAYLSPVKVHPLNHKAMNTRSDLIGKDPQLFAFLDTLITENRAYLAGDTTVMKHNWAQVYVTLAREARRSPARAHALLDTAALYAPRYIPALLERASLFQLQKQRAEADAAIRAALALDPAYAPSYRAAALNTESIAERIALYQRAATLETDLAERADLNRALRELYYDQAMYPEARQVTQQFVRTAPTPSTYLRDRKDDAEAFLAQMSHTLGDDGLPVLRELVIRKPQHPGYRAQLIWSLYDVGEMQEANRLLAEAERLLGATGRVPGSYRLLRFALDRRTATDTATVRELIGSSGQLSEHDRYRLAETLVLMLKFPEAQRLFPNDLTSTTPRQRAAYLYLQGRIKELDGQKAAAMMLYRASLAANPYHAWARSSLVQLLHAAGRHAEVLSVGKVEAERLGLGKYYWNTIKNAL